MAAQMASVNYNCAGLSFSSLIIDSRVAVFFGIPCLQGFKFQNIVVFGILPRWVHFPDKKTKVQHDSVTVPKVTLQERYETQN